MIIGIAGEKKAGKDSAFKIIRDYNYLFQNKKYAFKLKKILSILLGVPVERFEDDDFKEKFYYNTLTGSIKHISDIPEGEIIISSVLVKYPNKCWIKIRTLLQDFGTDMIKKKFPYIWINSLYDNYDSENDDWAITDVRYQDEVDAIIKRGGFVIRINRNNKSNDTHSSETSVSKLKNIKYNVDNNSPLNSGELKAIIKNILIDEGVKRYRTKV